MGAFLNETIFKLAHADDNVRSLPRFLTIIAAACAILFSVVGVLGKIYIIYYKFF